MLWHPKTLQNLAMYNVFFIFGRFSIAGKLPKWPKIPFQYPLALRHPKILEKCRKHHRILVSVRNGFCPPPAKADIATAILTNVIEHLVLLLPPNKHAFTAKAVWADFQHFSTYFNTLQQFDTVQELSNARTGRTAWPTGLCGDNERTRSTALSTWPCSVPYVCRTYLRALPKAATLNVTGRHWPSLAFIAFVSFVSFHCIPSCSACLQASVSSQHCRQNFAAIISCIFLIISPRPPRTWLW